MSIKDTIKSLEEADEKLQKAVVLEQSAVALRTESSKMQRESKINLEKMSAERERIEKLHTESAARLSRREEDLKNREATIAAKQADLVRKTEESCKECEARENEITRSDAALQKKITENKAEKDRLDKLAEKYKSIAEFITKNV